mmetsp:Transcript_116496/g.301930  ORF Transcript_116496/g.301930 Transcript_116496/m.301930 type:complete len:1114 (+) Transcript_116496:98-3439(+)
MPAPQPQIAGSTGDGIDGAAESVSAALRHRIGRKVFRQEPKAHVGRSLRLGPGVGPGVVQRRRPPQQNSSPSSVPVALRVADLRVTDNGLDVALQDIGDPAFPSAPSRSGPRDVWKRQQIHKQLSAPSPERPLAHFKQDWCILREDRRQPPRPLLRAARGPVAGSVSSHGDGGEVARGRRPSTSEVPTAPASAAAVAALAEVAASPTAPAVGSSMTDARPTRKLTKMITASPSGSPSSSPSPVPGVRAKVSGAKAAAALAVVPAPTTTTTSTQHEEQMEIEPPRWQPQQPSGKRGMPEAGHVLDGRGHKLRREKPFMATDEEEDEDEDESEEPLPLASLSSRDDLLVADADSIAEQTEDEDLEELQPPTLTSWSAPSSLAGDDIDTLSLEPSLHEAEEPDEEHELKLEPKLEKGNTLKRKIGSFVRVATVKRVRKRRLRRAAIPRASPVTVDEQGVRVVASWRQQALEEKEEQVGDVLVIEGEQMKGLHAGEITDTASSEAVGDQLLQTGDASCQAQQHRKRPNVAPYLPPHARKRKCEEARWQQEKAEWHRRLAEEDEIGMKAHAPTLPNMRSLAKKLEPWLEQHGTCRFNPLQKDQGVEIDEDGIRADCRDNPSAWLLAGQPRPAEGSACAGPGIKGLPVIMGGRYQFEVELLCDSAVVVGWSSAASLPSTFDTQAFGYAPEGRLTARRGAFGGVRCQSSCSSSCSSGSGSSSGGEERGYGLPFGKAGDVIGAMVEWVDEDDDAEAGPRISFALNGRSLGLAFDLSGPGGFCADHPPLQPHICQAWGPAFRILLRGAAAAAPLRFPVRGYLPLGESLEAHFCPFSVAVAQASELRVSSSLREEHLWTFQLPDSHVIELLLGDQLMAEVWQASWDEDLAEEDDDDNGELTAHVAWILGLLTSFVDSCDCNAASAPPPVATRRSGRRTALAAFRLRAHAARCLDRFAVPAAGQGRGSGNGGGGGSVCGGSLLKPSAAAILASAGRQTMAARPLKDASEASRQRLAEWRGEDFRTPGCTPTVARRLIHGSLGLQIPLSHLSQERCAAKARRRIAAPGSSDGKPPLFAAASADGAAAPTAGGALSSSFHLRGVLMQSRLRSATEFEREAAANGPR